MERLALPAPPGVDLLIFWPAGVCRIPLLATLVTISEHGRMGLLNAVTINGVDLEELEEVETAFLLPDGRVIETDPDALEWPSLEAWAADCRRAWTEPKG